MSIWVKAGLATLGAGAIGGVGAYAGGLFESKKEQPTQDTPTKLVINISSKLKDEGFETLDASKDDGWQAVLTEYKKPKKLFPATITIATTEHLKTECSKLFDKDSEVTDSYSLAKEWCVKKQKINEVLNKNKKFKFLTNSENDQWTTKINNLKNKPDTIKSLGITKNSGEAVTNNDLIQKCTEIGNLQTTDNDFLTKFELAKEWCSIPKS